MCKCVLLPGDNPIALNKYIIIYYFCLVSNHSGPGRLCKTAYHNFINLVPVLNNFSRGSYLRYTLYMRSLTWYGLTDQQFLSLQFLTKCPYLSHTPHNVSVFSPLFACSSPAFVPCVDRSTYSTLELTIVRDIYLPWYHVQFRFQCTKQPINQFSNTQRSITTAGYDELRRTSLCIKLSAILIPWIQKSGVFAEANCSLFLVTAVCVYLVKCLEGAGTEQERIDISGIGRGKSNLIYTAMCQHPVTNILSEAVLFTLVTFCLVCNCKHVEQSVDQSYCPDAAGNCT
jgi:hypothetical protein